MQRRWAPPHQPADKRCIAMQGEAMDDFYAARKAELQGELADLYRAVEAGQRSAADPAQVADLVERARAQTADW